MRYADSHCTYEEQYTPKHVYIFTGPCHITKKPYSVTVPAEELNAYRRGGYIQEAMPSVSKDDREFLISGMSPEGWKQTFGEPEDECFDDEGNPHPFGRNDETGLPETGDDTLAEEIADNIRTAVYETLGYEIDDDTISAAVHAYKDTNNAHLTTKLSQNEAALDAAGGRGVELADEIDEIRIALAVRSVEPDQD